MKGYEVQTGSGILLNANESMFSLPEELVRDLAERMSRLEFRRYPDHEMDALCQAYADYLQVDRDCLTVGNGSDEVIGLLIAAHAGGGGRLLTVSPDFSMYDYYVEVYRGEILKYEPGTERFDVEAFVAMAQRVRPDLIALSNPNNPTGRLLKREEVLRIVNALGDIPVLIDEAYAEFSDESVIDAVRRFRNLYVSRTLSKAFGLAGLRVGCMVSTKENIAALVGMRVPYTVSSFTQMAAAAALERRELFLERVSAIRRLRDEMARMLAERKWQNIRWFPSGANFFYGRSGLPVAATLAEAGFIIRDFGDGGFRITVGESDVNEAVVRILSTLDRESVRADGDADELRKSMLRALDALTELEELTGRISGADTKGEA